MGFILDGVAVQCAGDIGFDTRTIGAYEGVIAGDVPAFARGHLPSSPVRARKPVKARKSPLKSIGETGRLPF